MMKWWERERLLTDKDRSAIDKAKGQDFGDIDEDSAETIHGREILHEIAMRKYRAEEFSAGII